jgi:hypothetical protein
MTGGKSAPKTEKGHWRLVFQDSFDRLNIGDKWKIADGNFEIKNNSLCGRGEIFISAKFPGDQKLEFTGWVEKGKPACDISAMMAVKRICKNGYKNGYFFGFGNRGNVRNILMKDAAVIFKINAPMIELGKKHKIVCEKEGRVLKWWIDGKRIMMMKDFTPLSGKRIGLYIYVDSFIDDVKVYSKGE